MVDIIFTGMINSRNFSMQPDCDSLTILRVVHVSHKWQVEVARNGFVEVQIHEENLVLIMNFKPTMFHLLFIFEKKNFQTQL